MTAALTIASFNIHWGRGPRFRYEPFDVVAACRRLDADVLVLQECWAPDGGAGHHDEVAAALGCSAVVAPLGRAVSEPRPRVVDRPGGARRGDGDWCLAVLSRLPVRATAVTPLEPQLRADPASRALVRVEVDVDGRPLTVHGTHLAHLEFGVHRHRRALREALAPSDRPAVLIGDMNMWGWCISRMVPSGYRRVGRGRTYPARRPLARIDHLLVTDGVEVTTTEVVPNVGSDHRAIRARLVLR